MSWKRRFAVGVIAAGLGVGSQTARAEDPAPAKPDAAAEPKEALKAKACHKQWEDVLGTDAFKALL